MSDENTPDNIDEDDLLSDFNDLFPEEGAADTTASESGENDDGLDGMDDLDDLLNGLNSPTMDGEEEGGDALPDSLDGLENQGQEIANDSSDDAGDEFNSMLDEMMKETEPTGKGGINIDDDELNLFVDSDVPGHVTTNSDEPKASSATGERRKKGQNKSKKSPSKTRRIFVYLLLLAASGALWMQLQGPLTLDTPELWLNDMKTLVDRLQSDATNILPAPQDDPNTPSIRDLDQRINELSKMVDGPLRHMNANTSEEVIAKFEERLQKLEQELAETKKSTPVATPPPKKQTLVIKAQKSRSTSTVQKQWALNLLSFSSRARARQALKRIQDAGIDASISRFTTKDGKRWYRIRVTGFTSYKAAKAYAKEMPKVSGVSQTWIAPE